VLQRHTIRFTLFVFLPDNLICVRADLRSKEGV